MNSELEGLLPEYGMTAEESKAQLAAERKAQFAGMDAEAMLFQVAVQLQMSPLSMDANAQAIVNYINEWYAANRK